MNHFLLLGTLVFILLWLSPALILILWGVLAKNRAQADPETSATKNDCSGEPIVTR
jgi:hypothetical protein